MRTIYVRLTAGLGRIVVARDATRTWVLAPPDHDPAQLDALLRDDEREALRLAA